MSSDPNFENYEVLIADLFHVPNGAGEEPYLIGSRCEECGATFFPKMHVCPRGHRKMKDIQLGRCGKLFSVTIATVGVQGFDAPYYQAFVALPEGPRVFSLISEDVPVEEGVLVEGMDLDLVIEPVRVNADGRPVLTYKYRPASEST